MADKFDLTQDDFRDVLDRIEALENTVASLMMEEDHSKRTGWQAICNSHIGGWYGTCRENSSEGCTQAGEDKRVHDRDNHGGTSNAVVVKRSCG